MEKPAIPQTLRRMSGRKFGLIPRGAVRANAWTFVVAPPELGQREGEAFIRYHVNPMTRKLRKEQRCDPRLEARHRMTPKDK